MNHLPSITKQLYPRGNFAITNVIPMVRVGAVSHWRECECSFTLARMKNAQEPDLF